MDLPQDLQALVVVTSSISLAVHSGKVSEAVKFLGDPNQFAAPIWRRPGLMEG